MEERPAGPDYVSIETPEHVLFTYEVAGLMSRGLAVFLDHLIQLLFIIVLAFIVGFSGLGFRAATGDDADPLMQASIMLGVFAIQWGYFVFFETVWRGQTPGKRLLGIRVIREGGYRITPAVVMVRNLVRYIGDFGPLYPIGAVVMFLNRRCQRLGDFAAGTYVVRDTPWQPLRAVAAPVAGTWLDAAFVAELRRAGIHRLKKDYVRIIESFLARRGQIDANSRRQIALSVARPLASALQVPVGDPEGFLFHVAAARREEERA